MVPHNTHSMWVGGIAICPRALKVIQAKHRGLLQDKREGWSVGTDGVLMKY